MSQHFEVGDKVEVVGPWKNGLTDTIKKGAFSKENDGSIIINVAGYWFNTKELIVIRKNSNNLIKLWIENE